MSGNIHYIRAAIQAKTGVSLSLEATRDILIEEGLLTKAQANRLMFSGYDEYYKSDKVIDDTDEEEIKTIIPIENDVEIDLVDIIDDELVIDESTINIII